MLRTAATPETHASFLSQEAMENNIKVLVSVLQKALGISAQLDKKTLSSIAFHQNTEQPQESYIDVVIEGLRLVLTARADMYLHLPDKVVSCGNLEDARSAVPELIEAAVREYRKQFLH